MQVIDEQRIDMERTKRDFAKLLSDLDAEQQRHRDTRELLANCEDKCSKLY